MLSRISAWKDWIQRSQPYSALPSPNSDKIRRHSDDDDDDDTLKSQNCESALLEDELRFTRRRSPRLFSSLAIILIGPILGVAIIGAFLVGKSWRPHLDQTCMRHSSSYCVYPLAPSSPCVILSNVLQLPRWIKSATSCMTLNSTVWNSIYGTSFYYVPVC